MTKEIKIQYQNRESVYGNIPAVPKIILASKMLKDLSGFSIGDRASVEYSPNQIIISKLNNKIS